MSDKKCTCNKTHPSQCPKHKDAKLYHEIQHK